MDLGSQLAFGHVVALLIGVRLLTGWIIILSLLASPSVYAADICQAVFRSQGALIDARYGKTSQNDEYLEMEGLIAAHGSQLCGPTAIVNSLAKFHRIAGEPIPNGPMQIQKLVRDVFPLAMIDVERQGARLFDVGEAMRVAMRQDHMRGDVRMYSSAENDQRYSGSVTRKLLESSLKDDTVVIVQLGRYRDANAVDARLNNRGGGHFVILAGYNPDVPSEFFVLDPMWPNRFRRIELTLVSPERFPHDTYAVRFTDGGERAPTVLIEGIVVGHRDYK